MTNRSSAALLATMLALTANVPQMPGTPELLPSAMAQQPQTLHLSERAKKSYLKSLKAKRKVKK